VSFLKTVPLVFQANAIKDFLARKELMYQSQLLEKDKELHQREVLIQTLERQMMSVRSDVARLKKSEEEMM
jgi:hypothetical protein